MAGIFSGKYEDDFENTLTTENLTSTCTYVPAEDGAASNSPNSAQDGDSNDIAAHRSDGDQSDFDESAESEGEGGEDTLTVSFQDISTLRRSLELDHMIRESLVSESTSNVSEELVYSQSFDAISAIKIRLILALYKHCIVDNYQKNSPSKFSLLKKNCRMIRMETL